MKTRNLYTYIFMISFTFLGFLSVTEAGNNSVKVNTKREYCHCEEDRPTVVVTTDPDWGVVVEKSKYEVIDSKGKVVKTGFIFDGSTTVNTDGLAGGKYTIEAYAAWRYVGSNKDEDPYEDDDDSGKFKYLKDDRKGVNVAAKYDPSKFRPCGSTNTRVARFEDKCGNIVEINCQGGSYVLTYTDADGNSKVVGRCVYVGGVNSFGLWRTKDGCRFHSLVWKNHESAGGTDIGEGNPNAFDRQVWESNFVTGTTTHTCQEKSSPGSAWQTVTCP